MSKDALYLGDTKLDQAASYLAGVLAYYDVSFDYLASDERFESSLLNNSYKAIIISDYPAANFSEAQISGIVERVKNGTGLLMIGGWESFTGLDGRYNETSLKDVLPVIMQDSDDRINYSGPCLVEKNCEHEIVAGLAFGSDAPVIGGFNEFKAKQGSTTILSSRRFKASYNVGTPKSKVGFLFSIKFATSSGVNEGTKILFPPPINIAFTHTPNPKP